MLWKSYGIRSVVNQVMTLPLNGMKRYWWGDVRNWSSVLPLYGVT